MRYTYIASDTTAGNATTLGAADEDVYVHKVIFGTPADGKVLILYNKTTAYGSPSGIGSVDSNSIAAKITQPTAAAGKQYVNEVNFFKPLQLNGGAVHTDGSQVTIVWELASESSEG